MRSVTWPKLLRYGRLGHPMFFTCDNLTDAKCKCQTHIGWFAQYLSDFFGSGHVDFIKEANITLLFFQTKTLCGLKCKGMFCIAIIEKAHCRTYKQ